MKLLLSITLPILPLYATAELTRVIHYYLAFFYDSSIIKQLFYLEIGCIWGFYLLLVFVIQLLIWTNLLGFENDRQNS